MSEAFDEAGAGSDNSPEESRATRERGTIRFPYFDLADAQEIAQEVFQNGGSTIALDELAAHLNTTTTSSAFRGRVASASTFGVIETQRGTGRASLTMLGNRLADTRTVADALVEAFLTVPLYTRVYEDFKGKMLYGDAGLEKELVRMGVPSKQAAKARQVMMRSAETAGFLRMGRSRLVRPQSSLGDEGNEKPPERGRGEEPGDGAEDVAVDAHPLIRGLLQVLPPPGQPLSQPDRQRWLNTLDMNLAYIYPEPSPPAPTPQTPSSESPTESAQPDERSQTAAPA